MTALIIIASLGLGLAFGWLISSARVKRSMQDSLTQMGQKASAAEARSAELSKDKEKADSDFAEMRKTWDIERKELNEKVLDAVTKATSIEEKRISLNVQIDRLSQEKIQLEATLKEVGDNFGAEKEARIIAETALKESSKRFAEQQKAFDGLREESKQAFEALAAKVLNTNSENFLGQAKRTLDNILIDAKGDLGTRQEAIKGLVGPLSKALSDFDSKVNAMETARTSSNSNLLAQLATLGEDQKELRKVTSTLSNALTKPQVYGRWGENTLRRALELSGMSEHCDFVEQLSIPDEDSRLRPDMIIHLHGGRDIVVDSKVSLEAYLKAVDATSPEDHKRFLQDHAGQIRSQIKRLSDKAYWDRLNMSPECVILFISAESHLAAAAMIDKDLIEYGMERNVIVATPTTLILLLRAVAYGWQQEKMAQSAQEIKDLGKQLFDRMSNLADHISGVGKGLNSASRSYNDAVGSFERMVFPSARRFKDLGITSKKDIVMLDQVEVNLRELNTISISESPVLGLPEPLLEEEFQDEDSSQT